MRFKQFILEKTSYPTYNAVDEQEALDWIKRNCSKYVGNVVNRGASVIWRGMYISDNEDDFAIGDSNNFKRTSANTYNFINMLVSNSKNWKDYPSRESAYICATDIDYASGYGSPYLVIPADNAHLGICNSQDFWNSFKDTEQAFYDVESMNGFILALIQHIYPDRSETSISNYNYDELVDVMKSITGEMMEAVDIDEIDKFDQSLVSKGLEYINKMEVPNLFEAFEQMLDPDMNGFEHLTGAGFGDSPELEIWINGKCAFVNAELFDNTSDEAAIEWMRDNAI